MAFKDEVGSLDRIASALEGIAEGGSSLDSLSDVDLSNPTDGQTLVYNGTTHKWENGSSSGGGGALVVSVNPDTGALDKTWQEIHDAGLAVIWIQSSESEKNLAFFYNVRSESAIPLYVVSAALVTDDGTTTLYTIRFETGSADGYPVAQDQQDTNA